jgi:hypothetical protein
MLRDSAGRLLTRGELARPDVFREATANLSHYDPAYNYQHTAFIHFARLPLVGRSLQSNLNSLLPAWQERVNWTVLFERQSYSTFVVGIVLMLISIFLRRLTLWYGRNSSMVPGSPWDLLKNGGLALFSAASSGRTRASLSTRHAAPPEILNPRT